MRTVEAGISGRVWFLFAAMAAALFFAGCGGSGESGEAEAVEGTIQATKTTTHVTDMVETPHLADKTTDPVQIEPAPHL